MRTRPAATHAQLPSNASHLVQTQNKCREYIYAVQGIFAFFLTIKGALIGDQNQILSSSFIGGGLVLFTKAALGVVKTRSGTQNRRPLTEVVCLIIGTAFSAAGFVGIPSSPTDLFPWGALLTPIGLLGGLAIANLDDLILYYQEHRRERLEFAQRLAELRQPDAQAV